MVCTLVEHFNFPVHVITVRADSLKAYDGVGVVHPFTSMALILESVLQNVITRWAQARLPLSVCQVSERLVAAPAAAVWSRSPRGCT